MRYKIREVKKLGKGLYDTATYDGYGDYISIKLIGGLFKLIFNIFWIPIKYTVGLPFIIIKKLFGK